MAYCKNCGAEITNNETVCPNCGAMQLPETDNYNYTPAPIQVDNGGIGWGLLGCCIPIAGLILWLVWKDTKPKTAKAVGIGALVSVGISVLWYVLVFGMGILSILI